MPALSPLCLALSCQSPTPTVFPWCEDPVLGVWQVLSPSPQHSRLGPPPQGDPGSLHMLEPHLPSKCCFSHTQPLSLWPGGYGVTQGTHRVCRVGGFRRRSDGSLLMWLTASVTPCRDLLRGQGGRGRNVGLYLSCLLEPHLLLWEREAPPVSVHSQSPLLLSVRSTPPELLPPSPQAARATRMTQ